MRRKLVIASIVTVAIGLVLTVLTVSLGMNAERPNVVLLYTQNEKIPDLAFKVSSVPLAITSFIKLGGGTFAVLPATADNVVHTLANASFVVIGTHGSDGMLYTDDQMLIEPRKTPNFKMRGIYFGSCYFGVKRPSWEAMFPNAKVMGHDEVTYKTTGWTYLVFKSWLDLIAADFS